jgi:hypothetical protein
MFRQPESFISPLFRVARQVKSIVKGVSQRASLAQVGQVEDGKWGF